jgi:hypothetical protein
MAADHIIYCLEEVTDYTQFERLCHDLMTAEGFTDIEPLGGIKDKGRDAIYVSRSNPSDITIFAYSVREDWLSKLKEDAKKIQLNRHICNRLVFLCTSPFTATERDKAVSFIRREFGWSLDLYGLERLRILVNKNKWIIKEHPQIFHPAFFEERVDLSSFSPDYAKTDEDKLVYKTIMKNNASEIDKLLDNQLKFIREKITGKIRELVIDYIYDRWQQDRSWKGTVKPMKWLDTYFEFLTEKQNRYLIAVLEELTSTTPSFDALPYTSSIVEKITPHMLASIAKDFVIFSAKFILSHHKKYRSLILSKIQTLKESGILINESLKEMLHKILHFEDCKYDDPEYETIKTQIEDFAYPDLAKIRRERHKRTNE